MRVKQFFNEDFRDFSLDDTKRSLPCMVDGLKESQRKILYGLSTRGASAPKLRVEQLASLVSERTDYHHGGKSLEDAIVGLAQDFAGSNNMNVLEPLGQFGSRLSPEASAPRYIYTKFNGTFREIYRKEDDSILEHLYSDDLKIEPKYYLPIIPMLLVNGCRGVGTGYACIALSYNPREIKNNILSILQGKRMKTLIPWYNGFTGDIIRREDSNYTIRGVLKIVNTTIIKITELPIGTYLDRFKAHLIKLENTGVIKEFDDNSTEEQFEFIIKVPRTTTNLPLEELYSTFKLESKVTENLTVWNANGKIKKYKNANDLIKEFTAFRLEKYEVRRLKIIETYISNLKWLIEKLKFINYYLDNSVSFTRKGKDSLFQMLDKEGFVEIDRLLSLKIYNLTKDEIMKLKVDIKKVNGDIKVMKAKTAKEIYIDELKNMKI